MYKHWMKKNQQISHVILDQSTTQHIGHHFLMSPNPRMPEIDFKIIVSQDPHTWCRSQIDITSHLK